MLLVMLLILAACAEDPEARRSDIYAMKGDPTPENRQRIRGWLADEDRDVRATALNALVTLGVEDAESLALAGLSDPDGFVRATAAKLIGDVGSPDNVDKLVTRLVEDRDPVVRQRAAESLSLLGGESSIEGLRQALTDPMKNVRLAAVRGIRQLAPERDIPALSRLLLDDPMWDVRVQAARALAAGGNEEVVSVLHAAVDDPNEFVRAAVRHALNELGAPHEPVESEGDKR